VTQRDWGLMLLGAFGLFMAFLISMAIYRGFVPPAPLPKSCFEPPSVQSADAAVHAELPAPKQSIELAKAQKRCESERGEHQISSDFLFCDHPPRSADGGVTFVEVEQMLRDLGDSDAGARKGNWMLEISSGRILMDGEKF